MLSFRGVQQEVENRKSLRAAESRTGKRNNRHHERRLVLESLETRTLMSITPPWQAGAAEFTAALAALEDGATANTAPVAMVDSYAVNGHQQLGANVLVNDTDAEGDALSVSLSAGPTHGTLHLESDGTFIYAPDRRFEGVDVFTYRANDGQADSNEATVTISVTPANDAPLAVADAYHTQQDQPLSVPAASGLLANDRDPDDDPLTVSLVGLPENGTLSLQPDGSFEYTPNPGFHGADSFSYMANDGQLDSTLATVTVAVGAPNAAPGASDDQYGVDEDQPLVVSGPGVLANDSDVDGDALRTLLVSSPRNGTLILGRDGSFEYAPRADFHGVDTFSYKVNDGQADSAAATVDHHRESGGMTCRWQATICIRPRRIRCLRFRRKASWPKTKTSTATRWPPCWSAVRPTARLCSMRTARSPIRRTPASMARIASAMQPTTARRIPPQPRSRSR